VLAVSPKRLARFGLELNEDKTQLVDFRRPGQRAGEPNGAGTGPHGFDVLGFTHYWGHSRKGRWIVKRKTAKSRFSRALARVAQWCRYHRHLPVREQCKALSRRLRGHDAYFGITGNGLALSRFHLEVGRVWRKWLDRRSHHARMNWERFARLLANYPLPPPREVHSVYRS
jgi:RNA-directed DNA polymerase